MLMICCNKDICRSQDDYYLGEAHQDFSDFKVYRFAASLKVNNTLKPAVEVQNGYSFKTRGELL